MQGSRFRRVTTPADSPRRGILGHGSIPTLTSHAIRTSPVLRGKWILLFDRRVMTMVMTMVVLHPGEVS